MIKLIAIVGTFFLVQLFAHMTVVYFHGNKVLTERDQRYDFWSSFIIALSITSLSYT